MKGGREDKMTSLPISVDTKSVSFKNLKLRYENSTDWVLNDVTFDIPSGKTFVLVGSSGCGKTTLLRATAGLLRPKTRKNKFYNRFVDAILREGDECYLEGSIFFGGIDVTHTPPRKRHVAMVRQTWDLLPHLTTRETLLLPLKLQGIIGNEAEKFVADTLDTLGLSREKNKRPEQLSGGQVQRLAIGRLLVRKDARILLFDECLSSLDPSLRKQLIQFLKKILNKQQATSLWVTHLPEEARYMGDLVGVMDEGKIIQLGTYHELEVNPNSLLVCKTVSGTADEMIADVICKNCCVYIPELETPLFTIDSNYEGKAKLVIHDDGWIIDNKGIISIQITDVIPQGRTGFQIYAEISKNWQIEFVSNQPLKSGEQIQLSIDTSAVLLFAEDTGHRINCVPILPCYQKDKFTNSNLV